MKCKVCEEETVCASEDGRCEWCPWCGTLWKNTGPGEFCPVRPSVLNLARMEMIRLREVCQQLAVFVYRNIDAGIQAMEVVDVGMEVNWMDECKMMEQVGAFLSPPENLKIFQ